MQMLTVEIDVMETSGAPIGFTTFRQNAHPNSIGFLQNLNDLIFTISNPTITVISIVANMLTLLVMTRRKLRFTSVAVYLAALAISDSLVLFMDFLNNWLYIVPKINLLGLSDGFCRFHRFFFKVVYTYSAWIVISVCIERFIVVWFPLKAKSVCSYRNTVINASVLPLPIAALYMNNFWSWYSDANQTCSIVNDWNSFQSFVGPWITGFAYSYFPVIIMVVLNAAIVWRLWLARRRRQQMALQASASERKEIRITISIVIVCVFYIVMTVPLSIFYTFIYNNGEFVHTDPRLNLVRVIINMISSCSYGTTFFLYVLTSRIFRKQLLGLLCCCRCSLRNLPSHFHIFEGVGNSVSERGSAMDSASAISIVCDSSTAPEVLYSPSSVYRISSSIDRTAL